jgi:AcrR family transcriptional regulator
LIEKKKARRRSKLRVRLLEQAGVLFAERGFDNVTIREIAELAGTGLSDMYRHFADKRELYVEACANARRASGERYKEALAGPDAPKTRLLRFITVFCRDLLNDQRFSRLFVRELLDGTPTAIAALVEDNFRPQYELVLACLREIDDVAEPEVSAYTIYVLALGYVQMMEFGRAIPVAGMDWDNPDAMAYAVFRRIIPGASLTVSLQPEALSPAQSAEVAIRS